MNLAELEMLIPKGSHSSSNVVDDFNALNTTGALNEIALLRKENRELDKLINDASNLMSLTSVSEMLDYVISRFLDAFIPQYLCFLIQPPRGQHLRQYYYKNLKQVNEKMPVEFYTVLQTYFKENYAPIVCSEMPKNNFLTNYEKTLLSFKPELIFPLRSIGGLYGIVILSEKVLGDSYTDLEKLYIDRMMRFLAVGIQNGLHHESSITDPKTGLYNYDYFMQRLEDEVLRIKRHSGKAAIIMLDVDHFKTFNDNYGHIAGDLALQTLADVLRSVIRESDIIARFGGEEFMLLLIESEEDCVAEVSDRIRDAIECTPIFWEGEKLFITASLGVRVISTHTLSDSRSLIADVDKAMYLSKKNGRNRVSFYLPGLLQRAIDILQR